MDENEIQTIDAFDDMLGTMTGDPAEQPNTEQPEDGQTPDAGAADATGNSTDDAAAQAAQQNANTGVGNLPHNKQAQAFAALRVQTKQQQTALEKILTKAGLDPSLAANPQQVIQMIEESEVEEQAQEMQIPPEFLKRINHLERENNQQKQERLYAQAMQGLQDVQTRFNLTQEQLVEFATQMQSDGINPFEAPVDMEREYVFRNLDGIISKASQLAVQEALTRQGKAQQHSTQPPQKQGKTETEVRGDKINTMAGFDKLLIDLSK